MTGPLADRRRPRIVIPLAQQATGGLLSMLACLIAAPMVLSDYQLMLFSTGIGYSVAVLGVAIGFASIGMLALAQPAMMMIGGFLALHMIEQWRVPFVVAATCATAVGAIIALPLGWLTCRLDRFAFAVLSFTFAYLVAMLMSSSLLSDVSGGELGRPFPVDAALAFVPQGMAAYVIVATVGMIAFASAALLFRSTMGRILIVMNQDDVVARTMGINANSHRIALTAIVSGYGTLSGALVGQASGFIAPPQFDVALSISLLAMALVGGAGYLFGAFAGTMILQVMPAVLGLTQVDRELLVGIILLACLAVLPRGILAIGRRRLPRPPAGAGH